MPDNPQAYPCLDSSGDGLSMRDPGMTLRDWFAGQALTSTMRLVTSRESVEGESMAQTFARRAYELADAMLAEREKETRDAS